MTKETRQLSRQLMRASVTDGRLDQAKIAGLVQMLIEKKPRNYVAILENYKRLLRLEIEKRHARIESAQELSGEARQQILENLQRKYGADLTSEFVVIPELLGGLRVRVGSDVWDGTVRNRLQRLQQQL